MFDDSLPFTQADYLALAFFALAWIGLSRLLDRESLFGRTSLSSAMNKRRAEWLAQAARRDLRIIDTSILGGLQQGTAFFASSCLLAIGGVFALIGAPEQVGSVIAGLPIAPGMSALAIEIKFMGLALILAFAFFKFGWAYRLFNYCSILIGAIPVLAGDGDHAAHAQAVAARAARMNVIAGKHFNRGLRAVFFSLGYLGWLGGPLAFVATTGIVLAVLVRRQYFSAARRIATGEDMPE